MRLIMNTSRYGFIRIALLLPLLFLFVLQASAQTRVGYYDTAVGSGSAYQVPPITANGFTPVQMFDLTAADLAAANIDILWVLNPSNSGYGAEYVARLADIDAWVAAGGVLIFHDRYVTLAETILPGGAGFDIRRDFGDDADIDVRDNSTLVTTGSHGIIDDTSLDGGTSSTHGYSVIGTLPGTGTFILSRSDPDEIVTFSYPFSGGCVIYSSIPLDFYLKGAGPNPPRDNFRFIYSPNVIEYADAKRSSADVDFEKDVDNPNPGYLDTVTFTITLKNNEPFPLTGVEVTDLLPPGLIFDGAAGSPGGYNPGTGVWTIGTLNPNVTATLTIDAVVATLDATTNVAFITASTPAASGSASATVTPRAADLAIDKTVDNDAPAVGDSVTFTINVFHLDGGDVVNVRVEDHLPGGATFLSATTTQGTYNAATGIWQVGSMTEGQVETLLINAEITTTAPLTNTAFIAFANLPDPFPGDNTDAASLNAIAADLELTKTLTAFTTENGFITATFEVTVTNEGPSDTDGVEVVDYLTDDMSLISSTISQGALVATPPVLTWAVGTLEDGDSATMTVTVIVPQNGDLFNTAEVTDADLPDPDSVPGDGEGDDFAGASAAPRSVPDFVPGAGPAGIINRGDRFSADLALTKDVAVDADNAVYTIMVTNLGPQSTAKVEVTDHLPPCLTYDSSSADRGAYDPDTWIWEIGALKVGEKVTLEIVTVIGDDCAGDVINTATITASSLPDPTDFFNLFDQPAVANNSDDATFTVTTGKRAFDEETIALGANYPNPFNPSTMIPFRLNDAAHVSIKVYDLIGRTVATLVDGSMPAGEHTVSFDAGRLPTGMYLVRMEAAGIVQTQRITLMK